MKIAAVESLHADAGQRVFDFLKITTDDGLVGWSEYNESFGGVGVTGAIAGLAPQLIGKDPRPYEAHVTLMSAIRRQAAGGVIQQAIGAIENALLDIKARALGIPVYELLGGPVLMSAHFSAVVPNLRIMEIDPDRVPWYEELATVAPRIEGGHLVLPAGPGWGTAVDEKAVRAHPPRRRA